MGKTEATVAASCIGVIVPVCCFFAAWWMCVPFVSERAVSACALGGLGIGVLLDALFLRRWTERVYTAPLTPLALLHVVLSIIVYAVTMGVALSLLVPGTAAGVYVGRRLHAASVTGGERARSIRRASSYTALVIGVASAASGFLALVQPGMGEGLRSMLHLSFDVTRPMLLGAVLAGGTALILAQYLLTRKAAFIAAEVHRGGD